jgi:hypothetical protein
MVKKTGYSYDELKLNKIAISDLKKYIKIEEICKEEFYELNFGMKIAAIALTEDDRILIRTEGKTPIIYFHFSPDLIGALELTGFLEEGSNLKSLRKTLRTKLIQPRTYLPSFFLIFTAAVFYHFDFLP